MSLMQSSSNAHIPEKEAQFSLPSPPHDDDDADIFNEDKIKGSIYLMAAILVLSSSVVLQATTLGYFPAPISLSAITSFIGMSLTVIVELVQEHCLEIGFPLNIRDLIGFSLLPCWYVFYVHRSVFRAMG
ncbi:WAT1-related protein At5g47470-like [Nicotiana tabacum]|uniref:WAT1-related protein At5g47470-like n=1 Tax=Nicotiana tabacum TaxID=4097 RepID=A0AC58UGZ2_TOBAC